MSIRSTMNPRWRDYQIGMSFALWVCGIAFMVAALWMPIMPVEVYGDELTAISAEAWSIGVITASTMSLWGIYKNGRSRWSPVWRVTGYSIHLAIFLLFAAKAAETIFGLYLTIYSVFLFSTHMVFFIWVNVPDIKNMFKGTSWRSS